MLVRLTYRVARLTEPCSSQKTLSLNFKVYFRTGELTNIQNTQIYNLQEGNNIELLDDP